MNSIKWSILLFSFVLGTHAQTTTVTVNGDTVKVGEVTTMTCSYTLEAGDALDRLVWFRAEDDGSTVGANTLVSLVETINGRYSLSNDKDLMISTVEVNDAGNYLCRIVTQNVQTADDYGELIVQYVLEPFLKPEEGLSIMINGTATFTCTSLDGIPTPITITWIKDDVILDVSDMQKYPSSDATLTINKVVETDEGVYQCRAGNAAYSGNEGKLSNNVTLKLVLDTTTEPTKTTKDITLTESVTAMTLSTILDDGSKSSSNRLGSGAIAAIAICVSLVVLGLVCFITWYSYSNKKLCFEKSPACNVTKEGPSEVIGLTNDDDVTYAQVQKTAKSKEPEKTNNAPAKPKRAETNDTKKPAANAELTYVEVDHSQSGKGNKIIRTEPETTYSSVQPSSKR